MTEADKANLFLSYATLLLVDSGKEVSSENLGSLQKSSNVTVDGTLLNVFARAVTKIGTNSDLEEFLKVGAGGGGGATAGKSKISFTIIYFFLRCRSWR